MAKKTKAKSNSKAKSRKKNVKNNNLMMWVFVVLFLLIVISIAVILTLNGRSNPNTNKAFFESDGTKYVVESETLSVNTKDGPIAAYDVYYYSGDTITEHKAYYEFLDAETAEEALPSYQKFKDDEISAVGLDGRFIVLTAKPVQFENITIEMVKQWATENDDVVDGYSEDGEIDIEAEEGEQNIDATESVDETEVIEEASN